jgi:VWFA-related protein
MRLLSLPVLGLALLAAPSLRAQEAPSPGGPPPASKAPPPATQDVAEGQTLRVRVNLVNTYFSARDKGGFLTGLHKDDCEITENKETQVIKNFTQEKKLPLTIGILLDTSGSQMNVLPLEQESGAEFLKGMLTPKDEAFLISFDINVDLLADYTNNAGELRRALNKAQINTGAGTGSVTGNVTPKGTLLYDAVYLATHEKLHDEAGRKVIVMLTDGGDQGSSVKLKEAIESAQKANAIIYVILISDSGGFGMGGYTFGNPAGDMDRLARESGGRVLNIGHNARKLDEAFAQISDELRTQYLISYTPKNQDFDGTFRNIAITCGKDVKIQARKGYYAMSDSNTE